MAGRLRKSDPNISELCYVNDPPIHKRSFSSGIEVKGEKELLREKVASLCHEQWSHWMEFLFSKCKQNYDKSYTIPPEFVRRWQRQMSTPYDQLSEEERDSDRREADKFLKLTYLSRRCD